MDVTLVAATVSRDVRLSGLCTAHLKVTQRHTSITAR